MLTVINLPHVYYIGSGNIENIIYNKDEIELIKSYSTVASETVVSQDKIKYDFKYITDSSDLAPKQIYEIILKQKQELEEIYRRSTAVKVNAETCYSKAIHTNENCKKRVKDCENKISTLTNTANNLQQQLNNLQNEIQRKQNEYNAENEEYWRLERRNQRCRNVRFGAIIGGLLLSPLVVVAPPVIGIAGAVIGTTAITAALEASQRRLNAILNNLSSLRNTLHQRQVELNEVTTKIQEANAAKASTTSSIENDNKKPKIFHEIMNSLSKIQNFIENRQFLLDEILVLYRHHTNLPLPPTLELVHQHNRNFIKRVRSVYINHVEIINTKVEY